MLGDTYKRGFVADKERAEKLPLLAATKLALASFNLAFGPSTRSIA